MSSCKRCFAGRDENSICCICEQLGRRIVHGTDGCPFSASLDACMRCHQSGHLTKCCIIGDPRFERPTTLEECIPYSTRRRFKIHTHTKIVWVDKDRTSDVEIPNVNCFQVLDTYVGMKEFIDKYNIVVKKKTKESLEECRSAIEEWVRKRACRLEFVTPAGLE